MKVVAKKSSWVQTDASHRGMTRAVQTDAMKAEIKADESIPHLMHSVASTIAFLPRVLQKSAEKSTEEKGHDSIRDARLDKILVEMGSQTEELVEFQNVNPLLSVEIKEGDKMLTVTPDSNSALGNVQLYAQSMATISPLMPNISPYVLGSVVYPSTTPVTASQMTTPLSTPQMTPLPLEFRIARKSDSSAAAAAAAAATPWGSAPPATASAIELMRPQTEKTTLPSYKSYWRATPNSYTPQEALVSAGSVPPEQRCWKKLPKVVTAAVTAATRDSSNRTRTPSPRVQGPPPKAASPTPRVSSPHRRSPRPNALSGVQPLMGTRNYPNPYLVSKNAKSSHHQQRSVADTRPSPPTHAPPPLLPLPPHSKVEGPQNIEAEQQRQQQHHPYHQQPPQSQSPQTQQQRQPPQQAQLQQQQVQQQVQQQAQAQNPQVQAPNQQAQRYPGSGQAPGYTVPQYPGGDAATAAYYQQQYIYGQAATPYGYTYQYAPTWNWQ